MYSNLKYNLFVNYTYCAFNLSFYNYQQNHDYDSCNNKILLNEINKSIISSIYAQTVSSCSLGSSKISFRWF